ncbi:ribonuclease H-like domain-containing protein [Tanacetum coccineum]
MLLAIPDEHLLKFHGIKDVKTLWESIKARFRGNKESKKMQKTILKQQYDNFAASRSEGLDKTYDRFQKLISQLEIHGEVISREDVNLKLLRKNTSNTNEAANTAQRISTASFTRQASSQLKLYGVMFPSLLINLIVPKLTMKIWSRLIMMNLKRWILNGPGGHAYHEGEKILKEDMKESEFQWQRNYRDSGLLELSAEKASQQPLLPMLAIIHPDQRIFDRDDSRHMTGKQGPFLQNSKRIDGGLLAVLIHYPDLKADLDVESQVLLKVPRQNNMYSFDLKNVVPSGGLTCLFAKATIDESNLWHRRLGHINFKNVNKLVRGNLVRGLPSKLFENDHTCVACQKGKQHKASYKTHRLFPKSLEDAVADDAGKKTNEKPANDGERNSQEKEGGASNKEDDQKCKNFRAAFKINLLVQT